MAIPLPPPLILSLSKDRLRVFSLIEIANPCPASTIFAGPVASPENVTETLALGIRSNQRQFRQSTGCR